MTHAPHEEAEHASHHAGDPFTRRVAMSMVVIAAVLAMVKVLGHRTHNETLAYQIKAGGAQTQAGVYHTQESDQWNFFQSKKMREVLARQEAKLLLQQVTLGKEGSSSSSTPLPQRDARLKALVKELTDEKVANPDREARVIVKAADKSFQGLLIKGYSVDQADRIVDANITADRYRVESKAIAASASAKKKEAHAYEEKAEDYLVLSEKKHHQADFFDLGELGVELALVLSSVAILVKQPMAWYSGVAVGILGLIAVVFGFIAH